MWPLQLLLALLPVAHSIARLRVPQPQPATTMWPPHGSLTVHRVLEADVRW